ncbi:hypothetical protein F5B21DRAFT_458260, partial [Xylaria acuta]
MSEFGLAQSVHSPLAWRCYLVIAAAVSVVHAQVLTYAVPGRVDEQHFEPPPHSNQYLKTYLDGALPRAVNISVLLGRYCLARKHCLHQVPYAFFFFFFFF